MSGNTHDGELIRASLDAPECFGGIFERHYRVVDRYCVRRLGTDGHDVSANTFVEAFRVRHRFEFDRDDARPWLFGIVNNMTRRHRRTEARRWRAYARAEVSAPLQIDVDDRIDAAALGARLADSLATIPSRDRDALLLFAWADLSYEQVGQALEIPIGTVRSRISRARARLREALDGVVEIDDALAPSRVRGDEA